MASEDLGKGVTSEPVKSQKRMVLFGAAGILALLGVILLFTR